MWLSYRLKSVISRTVSIVFRWVGSSCSSPPRTAPFSPTRGVIRIKSVHYHTEIACFDPISHADILCLSLGLENHLNACPDIEAVEVLSAILQQESQKLEICDSMFQLITLCVGMAFHGTWTFLASWSPLLNSNQKTACCIGLDRNCHNQSLMMSD